MLIIAFKTASNKQVDYPDIITTQYATGFVNTTLNSLIINI